ncbi:DUF885 domain-containing protein [Solimicrobium silvestre]|uniref:DUF885 domain-containing protein n=1 Tax=Solimicrobium silvestre TaxID=2099400 RepID=A0A2S9GTM7_9BURK|nr:DUF885 domain-containing protein [Solimicrobium silvestre]PRC91046.1 hypothetical protein S2091_4234 [Solimicrobium silvestre]
MIKQSFKVVSALLITFALSPMQSYAGTDSAATASVKSVFEEYWQDQLIDNPERATLLGDNRYSDRLHDLSPKATAKRKSDRLSFEKRLNGIDTQGLNAEDQISLSILRYQTHKNIVLDAIFGDLPFSADDLPFAITQMNGLQLGIPQLLRATSLKTTKDVEMLIKRLDALPVYIDQLTYVLRAGVKSGWMPAAITLKKVPSQFDPLLTTALENNPMFQPFIKLPNGISVADQDKLRKEAKEVILQHALPALGKLQTFLATEYLPAASEHIAASQLPGKLAFYQAMLVSSNTTLKTPEEIHQIGLSEVDKIEKAMLDVMKETGFKGTPAEFNLFMNTDPQFFFSNPEAMLASYRDIAKRIDARLPEQFETLPRLPYGIRAMMPSEGDGPEHYTTGALDGSRAGYFEANVNNLKRRANWSMEDLVLHEAVPGHHLQIARAGELTGFPTFRRAYFNSGYGEGWALYAESLGYDLGMYTSPYTRYGYLSSQIFRACRLVVDTGIHAFGMTREEAIDYLITHAAVTHDFAVAEVDRYIVWPGQATGYKLGQLEIIALRNKAEKTLGAKFDIRKFNNQVVDHGGLPLEILNNVINQWIVTQQ